MINKIVALQGDHPSNLNPLTDTTIFLANEKTMKSLIYLKQTHKVSILNQLLI